MRVGRRLYTLGLACLWAAGCARAGHATEIDINTSWLEELSTPQGARRLRASVREAGLVQQPPAWVGKLPTPHLVAADLVVAIEPQPSLRLDLAMTLPEGTGAEVVLRVLPAGARRDGGWRTLRAQLDGRSAEATLVGTVLTLRAEGVSAPRRLRLEAVAQIPDVSGPLPEAEGRNAEDFGVYGAWGELGSLNLAWVMPQLAEQIDGDWDRRPLPSNGEHLYAGLHDLALRVTAPAGMALFGTGVITRAEALPTGQTRHTVMAPLTREGSLALTRDALTRTRQVGEIEVRVAAGATAMVPGGDVPAYLEALLGEAAQSLSGLTTALGPLPWREVEVVVVPGRTALASEFTGFVMVHQPPPLLPTPSDVIAHEFAHQWWYGVVGNDSQREPWVDESAATWTAAWLLGERFGPAKRREALLADELEKMLETEPNPIPATLPANSYSLTDYAEAVYGRGGMFYEALATEVGAERLVESLAAWHKASAGRLVTGAALREHLHTTLGAEAVSRAWLTWMEPVGVHTTRPPGAAADP